MMFRHVMVPYDGSDHAKNALNYAKDLVAGDADAKLSVVHAVPSSYMGVDRMGTDGALDGVPYGMLDYEEYQGVVKRVLDEAQKRGIANKDEELRKGKRFMTFFCLVIFAVLVAIIAGWNDLKDFKTASFETYLFLVAMNWFDGFVIDLLWVGHSKIWRIEGMEGVPYVKPWRAVVIKRSATMMLYLLVAAAVGGIVVLIGKI